MTTHMGHGLESLKKSFPLTVVTVISVDYCLYVKGVTKSPYNGKMFTRRIFHHPNKPVIGTRLPYPTARNFYNSTCKWDVRKHLVMQGEGRFPAYKTAEAYKDDIDAMYNLHNVTLDGTIEISEGLAVSGSYVVEDNPLSNSKWTTRFVGADQVKRAGPKQVAVEFLKSVYYRLRRTHTQYHDYPALWHHKFGRHDKYDLNALREGKIFNWTPGSGWLTDVTLAAKLLHQIDYPPTPFETLLFPKHSKELVTRLISAGKPCIWSPDYFNKEIPDVVPKPNPKAFHLLVPLPAQRVARHARYLRATGVRPGRMPPQPPGHARRACPGWGARG
jgi:hypothetical protein